MQNDQHNYKYRNTQKVPNVISAIAPDHSIISSVNFELDDCVPDASRLILKRRRAGVIYNPNSGSGKAQHTAENICEQLQAIGIDTILRKSDRYYESSEIDAYLNQLDFVMVAGGDGTLMSLLKPLARSGTPVYMLPSGNESLFARNFQMLSKTDIVIAVLQKPTLSRHHFGIVNGRPFFSMMSVGFDSEVVGYIDSYRNGPIGRIGYTVPIIRNYLLHRSPQLTLIADGNKVISSEKGYLIIANSNVYAGKLFLVPEADSHKDVLVSRFFPRHDRLDVMNWLLRYALGLSVNLMRSQLFTAKQFEVILEDTEYPIQADGDYVGSGHAHVTISTEKICALHAACLKEQGA